MSAWYVEMSDGSEISPPRDKARDKYEYISTYGFQAVIRRAKRTRRYKALTKGGHHIVAIIFPDGGRVTQF